MFTFFFGLFTLKSPDVGAISVPGCMELFFREPEGKLVTSIFLFVLRPSVLRKHIRNCWACLPTFHGFPERGAPSRPHRASLALKPHSTEKPNRNRP